MTNPMLDRQVVEELSVAMGAEFAAELVATFLADAPVMLKNLKTAVADGDADAYRRAAHSIKSNADIFGASALAAQARAMELVGLTQDDPPVDALEAVISETAAALKALSDG